MSRRSKKARKEHKKTVRRLRAANLDALHELRHTPVREFDPRLARTLANDLRTLAREPRYAQFRSRLYATARVVRGAPVPR